MSNKDIVTSFACSECDAPALTTADGINHHGTPGEIDHDADAKHVALDPAQADGSLAERIAKSFEEAAASTQDRKARISALLDRYPDGYRAAKWIKVKVAGDVFWNHKKRYLTSRQLLDHCGTGLIACGALTSEEYYS